MDVVGINDGSEYNKTKDQFSAGRTNWPRHKAQSSPLSVNNTNVLYVIASNVAVSNNSNGAKESAQSTSPISHVGIREGFRGLLL